MAKIRELQKNKINFFGISYRYEVKQSHKPSALVVYVTCKERPFPAHRLQVPSINMKCNPAHRTLLCREAIPMFDFLIEYYGKFKADKIIFIHGHERAWHYKRSVINVINTITKTEKFWNNEYGGLYKIRWHSNSVFTSNCTQGLVYQQMYKEIYGDTSINQYFPGYKVEFPCCSTFYISTELIMKNPLSLYITVRDRLINWSKTRIANNQSTKFCGYFMEFSWNLLFHRPLVDYATADYS